MERITPSDRPKTAQASALNIMTCYHGCLGSGPGFPVVWEVYL